MKNKTFFIINPSAGKGKGKKYLAQLAKTLQSLSIPLANILVTSYPGHATEIARTFDSKDCCVFCIGGDGTTNEVLNGISENINLKIGVIPIGSGNDFARAIGNLSNSFSLEQYISNNRSIKCDVGHVLITQNGQIILNKKFISSLGLGFDAFVASKIKDIKLLSGILLYISSVIISLFTFIAPKSRVIIEDEDIDFTDRVFIFTVGNTETAGGGFKLNPNAKIDDGFLNVCVARNISKMTLLQVLPKAITGKHILDKRVEVYKFKTIKYSTKERVYIHLDGEAEVLPEGEKFIEITVRPNEQEILINK